METKRWRVTLLVDIESFAGDDRDIIFDHFGPGEEGPLNIVDFTADEVTDDE